MQKNPISDLGSREIEIPDCTLLFDLDMSRVIKIEIKVCVDDNYKHQGDINKILDDMEDRHSSVTFLDAKILEDKIF